MVKKVSFLLFILINLTFGRDKYTPEQFLADTVNKDKFVFLKLKHVIQEYKYCVPASFSMVLDYYGHTVSQKTFALMTSSQSLNGGGTYFGNAIKAVTGMGFEWKVEKIGIGKFEDDFKKIKEELDNKQPVVVSLLLSRNHHAIVVVGYDEENERVFTIDPFYRSQKPYAGCMIYSYKNFNKIWKNDRYQRSYITTKQNSDKKQFKVLTQKQINDKNIEALKVIGNSIISKKSWAVHKENLKELEVEEPVNILEASKQSKTSEVRDFFRDYFLELLEMYQKNNSFAVFINKDFISSVLEYDADKKSYSLQIIHRKTLKFGEIKVREHQLEKYLATKLQNNRYAIYSYQFKILEE